jgi:DUF1707 SHOCT-like domain
MDDRIRISDSDRDRAASRLRDHYAEGRLTAEELDERVAATLKAKTAGDLRRVMADLPGSGPSRPNPGPYYGPAPWAYRRRGPRLLPLVLLLLIAALILPGGWIFFAFLKVFLLFWLLVALFGLVAGAMFRHRMRRMFRNVRRDGIEWEDWPRRRSW